MTQNEKAFILRDLCARLPYGVKFKINETYLTEDMIKGGYDKTQELYGITREGNVELLNMDYHTPVESIKPYLFPLSSMTEEQYIEMQNISAKDCLEFMEVEKEWRNNSPFNHLPLYQHKVIEFFHKHHFDYRGLIPIGVAIDATNLNIY